MRGNYSGRQLKLLRVARSVKATDLAQVMRVSHSTVSQIESRAIVRPEQAVAYKVALESFPEPPDYSETVSVLANVR